MKKYESPRIDIISLETSDIIATSEEFADAPDTLKVWGTSTKNLDSNAVDVFG